jgi:hypothetical protein
MKFDDFKDLELKKNEMTTLIGGTTTTLFQQVGMVENEYEDLNGNNELDKDEIKNPVQMIIGEDPKKKD